jgi:hypothetical protein
VDLPTIVRLTFAPCATAASRAITSALLGLSRFCHSVSTERSWFTLSRFAPKHHRKFGSVTRSTLDHHLVRARAVHALRKH